MSMTRPQQQLGESLELVAKPIVVDVQILELHARRRKQSLDRREEDLFLFQEVHVEMLVDRAPQLLHREHCFRSDGSLIAIEPGRDVDELLECGQKDHVLVEKVANRISNLRSVGNHLHRYSPSRTIATDCSARL